ncbi:MAG: hypothetical protein P1V35_13050 [Planctomycetota bacterium]|nr:hypothetical protein [Planctomycetota bacterium]
MHQLTHCTKCGLRFKADRLNAAGHCKSCRRVAGEYKPRVKPERRLKVVEEQHSWSTCGNCGMPGLELEEHCPACFWDPEGEFGTESIGDEEAYNNYDDSEGYNSKENIAARRQARTVTKRLGLVRWLVTAHLILVCVAMVAQVALMVMESSADRFNFKFGQLALQLLFLVDVRFELKSIHSTSRWGLRLAAGFTSVVALLWFYSPLGWLLGALSAAYWRGVWVNRDLDQIRAANPFAFLDGAWEEYNRKKILSELGKPGWWGTGPHRALLVTVPLMLLAIAPTGFQFLRPGGAVPKQSSRGFRPRGMRVMPWRWRPCRLLGEKVFGSSDWSARTRSGLGTAFCLAWIV